MTLDELIDAPVLDLDDDIAPVYDRGGVVLGISDEFDIEDQF